MTNKIEGSEQFVGQEENPSNFYVTKKSPPQPAGHIRRYADIEVSFFYLYKLIMKVDPKVASDASSVL